MPRPFDKAGQPLKIGRMPIAPLLKRFVDDELSRSGGLIAKTFAATLEQLRQPRDQLLGASERQHYFSLVQALQQHQEPYQRRFQEALRELVLSELEPEALAPRLHGAPSLSGLQLMDETRVESDIEISRAIQQIDTGAEWELRELQTFTSTLRGQPHVTAESNPLRPRSYACALWEAAKTVPVELPQQVILLRVSATVMAGFLRMAFAAACTRLESQGVTPGIYRTVVFGPGSTREGPPEVDVTQPGTLDGLMRSMPGALADRGTPARESHKRRSQPMAAPALEQALLRIEEAMRHAPSSLPAGPVDPAALQLSRHRDALMSTTGETVDRQIIELLSRLFEAILSDPALPAGLHAVIARLQVSALRIALLDPSMLDAYDHPVWVLMDRFVTAATAYPHASDPRLQSILGYCSGLVSEMAAQPMQDTALYQRSLVRLEDFLAEQLRQAQAAAQPAMDTLVRAEDAEELQRTLSARLVEQMRAIPTPPVIHRFVTSTWARVLTESVVRSGDQSEQTSRLLKIVDELLWSLKLPDHAQSRQRLVVVLPKLLQQLREGMALIDLPDNERESVLDELMKVHSEALKPGARASASTPDELSPAEIVRRMREEVPPEAAPLEPVAFSDSLIDLGSMETVPADLLAHTTPPAGSDPAAWVKGMAVGRYYRAFLHGSWTMVQLLWRSGHGRFLLFAGETPQSTHSISERALERLREAELLGPLHGHSLIQRAVDAMLRNLARPQ